MAEEDEPGRPDGVDAAEKEADTLVGRSGEKEADCRMLRRQRQSAYICLTAALMDTVINFGGGVTREEYQFPIATCYFITYAMRGV